MAEPLLHIFVAHTESFAWGVCPSFILSKMTEDGIRHIHQLSKKDFLLFMV